MAKLSVESVPPPGPTPPLEVVPVELDELDELLDVVVVLELDAAELELLVPPVHEMPQSAGTSPTHCASHELLQHHESCAQTSVAHVSHPDASAAPDVQTECAHVPPVELELDAALLELDAAVLELDAPLELDERLRPQGVVTGTQTLDRTPSALLTGMHSWPAAHELLVTQAGAQ
jgi:hypothetical protein